jgi:hypothetical protein
VSGGEKMMTLPGIPVAIFLEGFEIGNVATNAFAEGINSRGSKRRSRSGRRRRKELDTVGLKTRKVQIEPGSDVRRRLGTEPGEKRTKLLNLDDVQLLIGSAILGEGEEDGTVGGWIHRDKIGSIGHTSNSERGPEWSKVRGSRKGFTKKDSENMLEGIDIRSCDGSHDE